jgi:hypothetical protein
MDAIPQEVLIVGGIALLGLAVVVVARYAKRILLFLALVAGVVILGAIVWAWLQSSAASTEGGGTLHDLADIARVVTPKDQPAPAPAPTYTAPAPSGGGFCAGVLVALLAGAVGVGGYFWIRWKLAEWRKRPKRTRRDLQDRMPVVYIVPEQDFDALPLEELSEWDTNDYFQS